MTMTISAFADPPTQAALTATAWWSVWWLPVMLAPLVGSFLGVLVLRLPVGEPVIFDRSRCPGCGRVLSVLDLLPIVSWLALRGRCRTCGARLGWFYPLIEIAAGLVALWAAITVPPPVLWVSCGLGWALLALAVIDARHLLLPDPLTLPLIPTGFAVAAWIGVLPLSDHLIGACAGLLVPMALRAIYFRWRGREGLGLGDAKLLAAAGAWVSWQGLVGVVLIGSMAALVATLALAMHERRLQTQRPIAFGPFLCIGLWLVWLYGPLVP